MSISTIIAIILYLIIARGVGYGVYSFSKEDHFGSEKECVVLATICAIMWPIVEGYSLISTGIDYIDRIKTKKD